MNERYPEETRGWSRHSSGELRRNFFLGRDVMFTATVFPHGPPWRYTVTRQQKQDEVEWAASPQTLVMGSSATTLRRAKIFAVRTARAAEAKESAERELAKLKGTTQP